jgi:calcium-dependent protein kinase
MYIMLSGAPPFQGQDNEEILNEIARKDLEFPSEKWTRISEEAKDLIRELLNKDSRKRITARMALESA